MFKLEFCLDPVEEIEPWSRGGLSWDALTLGRYDLILGTHRVYRDDRYQVARIWEELACLASFALQPLPEALASRVGGAGWQAWWQRAWVHPDQALVDRALGWWRLRCLDNGHLPDTPPLHIWSHQDWVHLEAVSGEAWEVEVEEFRQALRRFNREFMQSMAQRLEDIAQGRVSPRGAVDLPALLQAQAQNEGLLDHRLSKTPGGLPGWEEVLTALSQLEALVPIQAVSAQDS